jgi:hypothetical protein
MDAVELALRKCLHVLGTPNTITERKVKERRNFLQNSNFYFKFQRNAETLAELLKENRTHEFLDSQILDENTAKRSITWNEVFNVRQSLLLSFYFIIFSTI